MRDVYRSMVVIWCTCICKRRPYMATLQISCITILRCTSAPIDSHKLWSQILDLVWPPYHARNTAKKKNVESTSIHFMKLKSRKHSSCMTAMLTIVNVMEKIIVGADFTRATRKVVDMKVMLQRMSYISGRILAPKMNLSILLDACIQRPSTLKSRRPMVFLD